jgi:6-phosphofructo-2-kinase
MLSTYNLNVIHSSNDTPFALRQNIIHYPKTKMPYRASVHDIRGYVNDSSLSAQCRIDPVSAIAAGPSRSAKQNSSHNVAPLRSNRNSPINDARRTIVSPEKGKLRVEVSTKLVIIMVGLPARGKSYVTKKLCRYLNWLQHDTKIFNVGNQRRRVAGRPLDIAAVGDLSGVIRPTSSLPEKLDQSAGFFDPDNIQAVKMREQVAMQTLDQLLDYLLEENGSVAIFDATNSTIERRSQIVRKVKERAGSKLPVLFLESQCFDIQVCLGLLLCS